MLLEFLAARSARTLKLQLAVTCLGFHVLATTELPYYHRPLASSREEQLRNPAYEPEL